MTETKYIKPQLGRMSASILCLMLIAAIILSADFVLTRKSATHIPAVQAITRFSIQMWLTGMCYGLAAGGCWLASICETRFLRWTLRLSLVLALSTVIDQLEPGKWLQDTANLGGLALLQSMLFVWLRVPDWRMATPEPDLHAEPKRYQFAIGDVVIATTSIALLLAIVIQNPPPVNRYWLWWFWSILVMFWLVGPVVAACIARSILNHPMRGASVGYIAFAIGLAAVAVAGLSATELFMFPPRLPLDRDTIELVASLYGRLIGGYLITFAVFAFAARIQGRMPAVQPDT